MNTRELRNAIELFRTYENDIPTASILCFLLLMDRPGLTVSQAQRELGLSKPATSRNMRNLTHRARKDKKGIDVARVVPDEEDYRVQCWYLNENGQKLVKKLKEALNHLEAA